MVAELTDSTFDAEIQNSKIPVLVDFWAPWCGPCRASLPHVERFANEYAGKVKVVKMNTDENQSVAARFGIFSIPTFLVFRPGDVSKAAVQQVGAVDFAKLTALVKPLLG